MQDQTDQLLTIEDLAARWQREVDAIYWMRSRGQGPAALRIGRTLRWRLADVETWEAEQAAEDARRRGRAA